MQVRSSEGGSPAHSSGRRRASDIQKQDKEPDKEGEDRGRGEEEAREGEEEEVITVSGINLDNMI